MGNEKSPVFDGLEGLVEGCKDPEAKKKLSLLVKHLGLLSKYMKADAQPNLGDPEGPPYDSGGRVECQLAIIKENYFGLLRSYQEIINNEYEELFDEDESEKKILDFLEHCNDLVKAEYSS